MSYFDEQLLNGQTEGGKAWLAKYIHPPSARPSNYNGYPDRSTNPSVHLEYRLTGERTPILPTNQPDVFSEIRLHSPGFFNPIYHASKATPFEDNVFIPCIKNEQVTIAEATRNFSRGRLSYMSSTYELDATAFNNTGMCYAAQIQPTVTEVSVLPFVATYINDHLSDPEAPNFAQKTKRLFDFIVSTCRMKHHNALKLRAMVGAVTRNADRFDWDLITEAHNFGSIPFTTTIIQIVALGRVITQATDITMTSPKAYTGRSTEGAFMVQQVTDDINNWCKVQPGYIAGGVVQLNSLPICAYSQNWLSGINYVEKVEFFGDQATTDLTWGDWSWGIVGFTNLSEQNANACIAHKVVQGWEFNVLPGGLMNTFTTSPALLDTEALDNGTRIMQARLDAMQSKYNIGGEAVIPALLESGVSVVKDIVKAATKDDHKLDENVDAVTKKIAATKLENSGQESDELKAIETIAGGGRDDMRTNVPNSNRVPATRVFYPRRRSTSRRRSITRSTSRRRTSRRRNSRRRSASRNRKRSSSRNQRKPVRKGRRPRNRRN